ncbi:hypothetical protein ES703_73317 [subsurface metagenome]
MSLTKREKEFVKEASELIEKKPELKPLVSLLNMLAEFIQDGFKKIEEKQTEFETTFRNIMKRLLDLEGKT